MTEPRRATTTSSAGPTTGEPGARIAELEARIAQLENSPGLRERGRGLMDRMVPPDAGRHFRNAGREQLLGIRSIVDFWIHRIDDSEGRPKTRHETIEID